jgi:tetratricopeptide (TPR) repeat protein
MTVVQLLILMLLQVGVPGLPDSNKINIINGGKTMTPTRTTFDAGPANGDGLNGHLFPAVIAYNIGDYQSALQDFTYMIRSPGYLDGNPRKDEFLGIAHYLRGMIYLYHAEGVGRHVLAKADFENAIKLNPTNLIPRLELSRVYSDLGFTAQAISIIKQLLALRPEKDIEDMAQAELNKLAKPN